MLTSEINNAQIQTKMPDEAVEADSSSFLPLLLAAPPGFLRTNFSLFFPND
jgi:hypothetical protein